MATIDVHSHVLPDIYLNVLQRAGITNIDGFPTPDWSLEAHLKMMDSHDIQACVLSLSSPGLEFAEPDLAAGRRIRSSDEACRFRTPDARRASG